MPESALFISERVEALLAALSSGGRPVGTSSYPDTIKRENRSTIRCAQSEDLDAWFRRCVKELCDGDPGKCELEENMAVFAYLEWDQPGALSYANVNVLCSACSLEDYLLDDEGHPRAQYLRLDLDFETLGPIFGHPLPHIHVVPHEPVARFEIDEFGSSNIVVDFLELAYRHLQHARWLNWARTIWRPYFHERATKFGDNMETVIIAFRGNDIQVLRRFGDDIREMRRLVRTRKEEIVDASQPNRRRFDLTMRAADRELLAFAGRG